MLPRNAELRNLKLGAFRVHKNEFVKPIPLVYGIVSIHMAKANQEGGYIDNRGIAHTANVLEDPLLLLSEHCADRLFMKQGQPLSETYLASNEWYVAL
jgi:hypothetical protein